jgi:hypothetical protein
MVAGGMDADPRRPRNVGLLQNSPVSEIGSSFYDAAVVSQTDKVTPPNKTSAHSTHHYEYLYQKYLGHINPQTPLRLLEIGLGFGMPAPHVAGSSLNVSLVQGCRFACVPCVLCSYTVWCIPALPCLRNLE